MQRLTNANRLNMPKLGLGTWPMLGEDCTKAVMQALELGYRHIDTAAAYDNEEAVGAALTATSVPREEIHVTTKVWWDQLEPQKLHASFERSLKALSSDYVDLFLIHWPTKDWDLPRTIKALVALKESGKAKAIGVANFPLPLLREVVEGLGAPLAALQVEFHVLLGQAKLLDYCLAHDIALTAYSPLARNKVSEVPELIAIADKHGMLPTQVALAWLLDQQGVAAVPKAAGRTNQLSNLNALNIRLDDEDRAKIAALPKDQRLVNPAFAPNWSDGE
ncbi:aldo/keto reductase [Acidocella aminolytica]|uniref:Aldo/keto reductase n=1 Tax=Acidocella aminolytica 101 = DSM 11237 TaxID=1120923 RepID=A0A0D6PE03_9PROT|nr:aldo/keto reductase [Acidocella aminolytica]GAN79581.1 aldo/keto reductase [Acidocella aminolytica 101 = DSM 11237]GBQ39087.1 aldo/keto reductase [Acidocella aminolytica 101 = DSM 11237]SHF27688.1 2,5-diketo-D-gluconate reductase B [Acidocella aminolytica 101 = DSM 11237]